MADHEPVTSLRDKHSEPLIIRKYVRPFGFPVFVAMICGNDLSALDDSVNTYVREYWTKETRSIQQLRNFFGNLTEYLVEEYDKTEGCAVVAFADKLVVSSLWGDFMTHHQCRLELFSLLNMTTDV